MKRIVFWVSVVSLLLHESGSAQTLFPGKKGAELRSMLREEFTPNTYLNYNAARAMMFGTIDNNDGKVELAYTTETFPINPSSPIPDANVVNTEHTWPQSMFNHQDGPGMKTDLHHLFPSRNPVNAARGNKPFAEIPDEVPHKWWNGPTPVNPPPANAKDRFSEGTGTVFEPEEDHKGNVARAMVYFFTIYEDDPNLVKSFFTPQVVTLKSWHAQDAADAREKDRGHRIELVQGNLNPFVIDPTLLDRALDDIVPVAPGPLAGGGPATPPIGPSPVPGGANTDPIIGVSIVALLPNPEGPDENNESVTIANATTAEVDLAGWKLTDKADREFVLSGKVPAGQTLSIRLVNSKMILGNNGSEVSLFDQTGARRQTVSYTKQQARSGSFVLFGG